MSDSSDSSKSCPKCGAILPSEATAGLCPNCLMNEALQPTQVSDASKPRHSAILAPEALAPFLPQYEILRMLGRGGMGAVYLARQISLNRLVAIKVLPADMGESELGFAERFKNEAQAMAQLSHPGIVAVYDFGQTTNGLLYIVMEYIEGTDVQLMLASQGRLHSAHAMAITAHVCDALQYAHTRGIIHRDIKPSNIMVSNDGVVKVADFGLAKMSHAQTTGLTQSGMAMGTPHFMAPEALTLGSAVDQRADIYAVGVMLYQMLTGKLPQGMFEMPSFQVPGLDPRYDRIVAKALREDRSVRYQAAADLRHDLDAILTQPVEKVAPEADEVKALPPVEARAKKAKAQRLPKIEVGTPVPEKKSPAGMIVTLVGGAAVVVAGWLFFSGRGQKAGGMPDGGGVMGGPDTVHATPTTKIEEASVEHPFVNSLGMKFVPVPGTKVLFGIWHTRVKDYAAFAKTKKVDDSWTRQQIDGVDVGREPDHPVVGVNWDDAQAFCQWLTARDIAADRVPSGAKYRLPTDEEWSIAAGLPLESGTPAEKGRQQIWVFPWGKDFPPPEANVGNYADSFYYQKLSHTMLPRETNASDSKQMAQYSDGFITTSPVGTFPANAFGLYDMGGNVWQMCADWFDDSHQYRVRRGSAWNSWTFGYLRLNSRNQAHPDDRINVTGFRCVLELPAALVDTTVAPTFSVASASKEAPFVNTLGMKFVPVPIGGGPTVGKRVLFSIWDTRVQDYLAFARANSKVDGRWQEQQKDGVPAGRELDHPVVGVNWEDAQAFCRWLTLKETAEGKLPPGMKYRLPSDEEWSWAVGLAQEAGETPAEKSGKNGVDFPWGALFLKTGKEGNYSDEAHHAKFPNMKTGWFVGYTDGFATTSPVGSFSANVHGLYDMGGNVWQWCEDWFDGHQKERVLRGGSWACGGRLTLLSSYRKNCESGTRGLDNGFRCVLESPVAAQASQAAASTSAAHVPIPIGEIATQPVDGFGLPLAGRRTFNGVPFEFANPPKYFITQNQYQPQAPVSGALKVNVPGAAEVFLMMCGKGGGTPELEGKEIGNVTLGFLDGSSFTAPLKMETHLRRASWLSDFTNPVKPPGDEVVQVSEAIVEPQFRGRPAKGYMDMLTIKLPPEKTGLTLTGITFNDTSVQTVKSMGPGFDVYAVTVKKAGSANAVAAQKIGDPPGTVRRVVDLMPLVDAKRDAMGGSWSVKGSDLLLAPGAENSPRIQFPHAIATDEFDFEIEFSPVGDQPAHVGQRFPGAGRQLYWALNLFKDSLPFFGFPDLDGQTPVGSTEARVWRPGLMPPKTRHRSIVQVRKSSLTGTLNGETLVHWAGDLGRFHEVGGLKPRDIRFPVISADKDGIVIHKAVITEFVPR